MLYAVIVAGGNGSRMQSSIPKQFICVHEKPILWYTIRAFVNAFPTIQIKLVLPRQLDRYKKMLDEILLLSSNIQVIEGGETRFHSVQRGIQSIQTTEGIVFIHDGVRPIITEALLQRCYVTAEEKGHAIPCVPLKDSIRLIHPDHSNTAVDRSMYLAVQTPQTFTLALIKRAFETDYQSIFTDEASILDYLNIPVNIVVGDVQNIKITTPEDLYVATQLLASTEFDLNHQTDK